MFVPFSSKIFISNIAKRTKLMKADWPVKRGFFFVTLLVKIAKLLAHDWSSGCLATAMLSCNNTVSFRDG